MTRRLIAFAPLIALLAAALLPLLLQTYQVTVITYVMIAAVACIGLVLMTGIVGMVSFGHAAFVGLGAYVSGYLSAQLELSPWLGLAGAIVAAGVAAALIGAITVRMSGHYLALSTLCFGISFYFLVGNSELLGRFNGLTGIPPVSIGGVELRGERQTYYLALIALALVMAWCRQLLDSRNGRILRSLRTGPAIAETFGADAQRYRLLAFILAAVIGAIAGWLYAHVQRFLNPTPFGLNASIDYLFMTVIGGSGQLWGALLGAGLVTIIKHELQDVLKLVFGPTTRLEMLFFAAIMIVVLQKARTAPTDGSDGSTVNHFGFLVKSYAETKAKLTAANITFAMDNDKTKQIIANFPEKVRVEFTEDASLKTPAAFHHMHLYTTNQENLRAWYVKTFGGTEGKRGNWP